MPNKEVIIEKVSVNADKILLTFKGEDGTTFLNIPRTDAELLLQLFVSPQATLLDSRGQLVGKAIKVEAETEEAIQTAITNVLSGIALNIATS